MNDRAARMVILCEDSQQYTFIYRLLKSLGFPRGRIRVERAQEGEGAADQYVRTHYPDEVAVYRRKSARMHFGLVTAIDADTETVQDRHQELDDALEEADQAPRRKREEICVLVPKHEIETWIYALFGERVDEDTKYGKLENEGDCQPAVEQLVEYIQDGWPDDLIPSLKRGCRELNTRLPE